MDMHICTSDMYKLEVNCIQLAADDGRTFVAGWVQLTRKDGSVLVRRLLVN